MADLLADELNVKKVSILGSAGEAVAYSLKPLPKQLGQKYKGLFPKVSQAVLALDPLQAAPLLLSGERVQVMVDGISLDLLPEEVEVRAEARHGLVVASEGAYLAALHTGLDEALILEGLAREFVRRVQEARKQLGYEIADRITLVYQATPRLAQAIETHREYVMGEVLALEMRTGEHSGEQAEVTHAFDEETVVTWLRRSTPA